jgi:hypothetical protein
MKKHLLIASLLASLSATAAWAAKPDTKENAEQHQPASDDLMTHPAYPETQEAPAKTASEAASSTASEWGATPELLEEMPDDH